MKSEEIKENNIAFNCLQHLRRSDYAMIWEGNHYDPDKDVHDYAQLTDGTIVALVCKIANIFEQLLTKNSTIALYLPPSIQLPLCLLAAAKIGHAPLIIDPLTTNDFVPALRETSVSAIITLDAFWHGDKLIESKRILDETIGELDTIKSVIVINHTASSKAIPKRSKEIVGRRPNSSIEIPFSDDRDQRWSSLIQKSSIVNDTWKNNDMIAFLFNSGKVDVLRRDCVESASRSMSKASADLSTPLLLIASPSSPFFCISLFAVFPLGIPIVLFEGSLIFPTGERLLQIIDKYKISHLIVSSPLPPLLTPIPHSVISVRSPKDVRFSIRHLFPNAKFEPFDLPK